MRNSGDSTVCSYAYWDSDHDSVTNEDEYASFIYLSFLLLSVMLIICGAAPHEFTSVPFPVKALKLLVHDLRSGGDSATIPKAEYDVDSDDGVRTAAHPLIHSLNDLQDEEWTEEQNQGFKQEEFAFLSEMLGPRGVNFDNDDILEETDDEDLRTDVISQIDMQVCALGLLATRVCLNVDFFRHIWCRSSKNAHRTTSTTFLRTSTICRLRRSWLFAMLLTTDLIV
jgi:hypothetical protein